MVTSFRPAEYVATVDVAFVTPDNVKVTLTETGIRIAFRANDGTKFVIYDNRPEVRAAFEAVRLASDQADVAEQVKESNRCKSNILACNEAITAYHTAVEDWKIALGTEAFVQVRENVDTGYLYGTFGTPKKDGWRAWTIFHILIDLEVPRIPRGAMWSTRIGNIALFFTHIKAENKATPAEPEGVEPLEVGPAVNEEPAAAPVEQPRYEVVDLAQLGLTNTELQLATAPSI